MEADCTCAIVSLPSAFTPFHFCGQQENRTVSSPPESPWNRLIWADSAFAIPKIAQHHKVCLAWRFPYQAQALRAVCGR